MLSIDTCDNYGLTTRFAFQKLSHADFASEIILYLMFMQVIHHPFAMWHAIHLNVSRKFISLQIIATNLKDDYKLFQKC